jgi:hypothetical protein
MLGGEVEGGCCSGLSDCKLVGEARERRECWFGVLGMRVCLG